MAHEIPEKYLNREARIFGVYGLGEKYSDYLNIRIEKRNEVGYYDKI